MIEYLPKWHNIDKLTELVQFVGVKREGYQTETTYPVCEVTAPIIEISSTMIRERFRQQQSADFLLPQEVIGYIEENHLYES